MPGERYSLCILIPVSVYHSSISSSEEGVSTEISFTELDSRYVAFIPVIEILPEEFPASPGLKENETSFTGQIAASAVSRYCNSRCGSI